MAKYPHMKQGEIRVWDAYLEEHGTPAGRVEYDVRLGEGAPIDPSWPPWMEAMVKALSQKRADVVAETSEDITIFEIKRRAGMSCLGQLMGYEALMMKEIGGFKPVRLVAVCEELEPDMEDAFDYYKVEVIIVSPNSQ